MEDHEIKYLAEVVRATVFSATVAKGHTGGFDAAWSLGTDAMVEYERRLTDELNGETPK